MLCPIFDHLQGIISLTPQFSISEKESGTYVVPIVKICNLLTHSYWCTLSLDGAKFLWMKYVITSISLSHTL